MARYVEVLAEALEVELHLLRHGAHHGVHGEAAVEPRGGQFGAVHRMNERRVSNEIFDLVFLQSPDEMHPGAGRLIKRCPLGQLLYPVLAHIGHTG